MKRLTITFIITILFESLLIVGGGIWLFKSFALASNPPNMPLSILGNPYIFFTIIGLFLIFIIWKTSGDFRSLSKYYNSIAQLGLKPVYGGVNIFTYSAGKTTNFDNYFKGGVTGEVEIDVNGKKVKNMNLYQPGTSKNTVTVFFNQNLGYIKLIGVFETDFDQKDLAFRIKKGTTNDQATTRKSSKDTEYALISFPGVVSNNSFAQFEGKPENVYKSFASNFLDLLEQLPGENMLVAQNGKIRLIHDGIVNTPEHIKKFAEALIVMLKA